MHDLTIQRVTSESDLKAFIHFPWKVYQGDRYWVPPLLSERHYFLDPQRNPFFQHARAEYFLARRGAEVVGTVGAFTNDLYNQIHASNDGFFGFFEVLDDREAAEALLTTAEDWARAAGHTNLIGPAQFSTNDELGLLIDGFDDPPRILMTYNPPRYRGYLEQAGYQKAMDLWAYALQMTDFKDRVPEKLKRVVEKVKQRGKWRIRRMEMKHFDREVELVKKVYNRSWEKNWGFVRMTDPEFDKLAENLRQFLDPDLAVLVECDGEVAGFGLSLPDLNEPLLKAYPRPDTPEWWTMARLAWHWKVRGGMKWLRVFALGVLPEFRGTGVDAMMYLETAKSAIPKGYQMAEMSWILEDNLMMNRAIQFLGGKVYKTYRMFQKPL
jgi:GNAT superfamily N-acetyltransferase